MLHSWLTIAVFSFSFSLFFCHAKAYTWQFTSQPIQCQNVSIAIQGSGQPPYNLVLAPFDQLPMPNTPEFRTVQNISFTGTSTTLSFILNYPENSSFVAVVCPNRHCAHLLELLAYCLAHHPQVSDSSGFGTGGTSARVTVHPSSDSSCYDTKGVQLPWDYQIAPGPSSIITQCELARLWWGEGEVNRCVLHSSAVSVPFFCFWLSSSLTVSFISRHTMQHCQFFRHYPRGRFLQHPRRPFVHDQ